VCGFQKDQKRRLSCGFDTRGDRRGGGGDDDSEDVQAEDEFDDECDCGVLSVDSSPVGHDARKHRERSYKMIINLNYYYTLIPPSFSSIDPQRFHLPPV